MAILNRAAPLMAAVKSTHRPVAAPNYQEIRKYEPQVTQYYIKCVLSHNVIGVKGKKNTGLQKIARLCNVKFCLILKLYQRLLFLRVGTSGGE